MSFLGLAGDVDDDVDRFWRVGVEVVLSTCIAADVAGVKDG
jgi:hypothetical protein